MRFHKLSSMILAGAVVLAAVVAQAAITMDTVFVGNPGNTGEHSGAGVGGYGPDRICGAVAYTYNIGKYEVTNAQYCEFLNGKLPTINDSEMGTVLTNDNFGLYNRNMETQVYGGIHYDPGGETNKKFSVKSGYANRPVVYVSWYDGIRFANWLQNSQGSGSTESGTYQIDGGGKNSGTVHIPTAANRLGWTSANPHWVLPSEDEWYKAAYHKNDGKTGNYWDYPTSTNTVPYSDDPELLNYPTNSANYYYNDGSNNGFNDGYAVASPYLTNVGAYAQSLSPYGTLDQGGNAWEWNEADIWGGDSNRGLRGGNFSMIPDLLDSSDRGHTAGTPTNEVENIGFRVASVPEPGSLAMLAGIALTALLYWWRKRA